MTSILFVCLGNICRSPLAEGVFRAVADKSGHGGPLRVDSAGTGAWHVGNPPDPRSVEVAARHGIDISRQKARQVTDDDFHVFDHILAMDPDNLAHLKRMQARSGGTLPRLFLETPDRAVPDPYYGGADGFEQVYRLIEAGSLALLDRLAR